MKRSLSFLVAGGLVAAFLAAGTDATATPALGDSHTLNKSAVARATQHPAKQKDTIPPGPVADLRVTATALRSVGLSWTDPTDADLAHVMIRRAVGDQAPTSNSDGTLVAVLGKEQTAFTDKHLTPATTYSYAVFTLDHHKNHSAPSDVSAMTATTDAHTGLKGILTDQQGRPIGNVGVDVYRTDGTYGQLTQTDSSGHFTATNLEPGSWTVCFEPRENSTGRSASGYLPGCYQQAPFAYGGSGTPITVSAGRITSGIKDFLHPAGAISGRLDDTAGHPAVTVNVEVVQTQPPYYFSYSTQSGTDGRYVLKNLPTGTYGICFDSSYPTPSSPTGYVRQCYKNEPEYAQDPIAVIDGQTTTGIDATLQVGSEVKGHVVDEQGNPAQGVQLDLSPRSDANSQSSDYQGNYDYTGITPGRYQACFDGLFGSSPTAPYGYASDCANPINPPFDVAAGQTIVLNATVDRAGAIGGVVTGNGQPVSGTLVQVFDASTGYEINGTDTAADGTWRVPALAAGSYTVCYDPTYSEGGFRRGCYDAALGVSDNGTTVPVTPAELTTVDVALVQGASITGSITDSTGNPISNVAITAYPLSEGAGSFNGYTDDSGHYTLGGVTAGQYALCFDTSRATGSSSTGYLPECYNNKPDEEDADPVTVGDSGAVTVDATLDPGGAISGQVTDTAGHPLEDVYVDVYSTSNLPTTVVTDQSGDYTAPGLGAGSATVCFDPRDVYGSSTTGYVKQCWQGRTGDYGGDPVTVTIGQTVTGIDAELAYGAELTGTLTDSAGDAIPDASIDVEGADGSYLGAYGYTDSSGQYTVAGLPAVSVKVCFSAYYGGANGTGYVSQCWQNAADLSTATPIPLTAGQVSSGIDATLLDAPAA